MKKLFVFLLIISLFAINFSCTEQEPFMYPETEPKMPETYSTVYKKEVISFNPE